MFKNICKTLFESKRCVFRSTTRCKAIYKVRDEWPTTAGAGAHVNAFAGRSHTCGQLGVENVGQTVRLCGWIQYQRVGKFVILRDSYGVTQVFLNERQMQRLVAKLMPESVVEVSGQVVKRPDKDINPDLPTGTVEVMADSVVVLNECRKDVPFIIRDYHTVNERTRLEYRYLDIRHPRMQSILRLRSQVVNKMRQLLSEEYGFVEVETPTLFKATPGGAKEFVVPTEFKDCFYNLVQSPQQFKQLLMIGAIDRYFQIARCYRNEGTKADRQPEFTQLDLEMSFTTPDAVMSLTEQLIQFCWPFTEENICIPFQRMSYSDVIQHYGTDKPDLRSDLRLKSIDLNQTNDSSDKSCLTLVVSQQNSEVNQKLHDFMNSMEVIKRVMNFTGKLFYNKTIENSNESNFDDLDEDIKQNICNQYQLKSDDHLWVAIGSERDVRRIMGRIRADFVKISEECKSPEDKRLLSFVWITDFPLFTPNEESTRLESTHHPFTAPQPQHSQLLYTSPSAVLGQHFDLVLNGQEVGGGSIRIHDHRMQAFVLQEVLKEDVQSMQYFLDALRSGCPPHGGIALGLDRLIAIMCGTDSIRDVIAFPKSAHGKDLMAGSPTAIPQSVKQLYHL